MGGRIVNNLLG